MPEKEMTMVERVARALLKHDGFLESEEISWRQYAPMAVVAIEAMRDPTEAMGEAADDPVHNSLKEQGQFSIEKYGKLAFASYPFSMAVWKSMIDAALKEQEKAG